LDTVVDGVGKIVVKGGLARVELLRFEGLASADEAEELAVGSRLAMSLETLLKLHQGLSSVLEQLESKGVLQKRASNPQTKSTKKVN